MRTTADIASNQRMDDLDIAANMFLEEYEMIANENKMFAQYLSHLGVSQEDVAHIANNGEANISHVALKDILWNILKRE